MNMGIMIDGKIHHIKPSQAIGKGGEADVYLLGTGRAVKIFKSPDHPDYQGMPQEQAAARDRLALHQTKLPAFPGNLPERAIVPEALATESNNGQIVGYSMKFLDGTDLLCRFSDPNFRQTVIGNEAVQAVFLDLFQTVRGLHEKRVVIGDFNDLNVLVKNQEAWLIDTDSFQFGSFPCPVYTQRVLDPLVCVEQQGIPVPARPHSEETDWYAFAVLLMESLLLVNPFGGVYRPKDAARKIAHELRPMHGISVFQADVRYPKSAIHFQTLPDELLQTFAEIFEKKKRGIFPRMLLENLLWTTCPQCGSEHARRVCPACSGPSTQQTVQIIVGERLTVKSLFKTRGRILFSKLSGDKVRLVYHESGQFFREDHSFLIAGPSEQGIHFEIDHDQCWIAKGNHLVCLTPHVSVKSRAGEQGRGMSRENVPVDLFLGKPQFIIVEGVLLRITQGMLIRDKGLSPDLIGEVLQGQTCFWAGAKFGFGFYRAGHLSVAFVFGTRSGRLYDGVKLPRLPGQLVDGQCYFSDEYCWFFAETRDQGNRVILCSVIRSDGEIVAQAAAINPGNGWLSGIQGKAAIGRVLLAVTDSGLVRVEIQNGQVVETRQFPDVEPYANEFCRLYAVSDGLLIVNEQEVRLLQLRP